MFVHLELVPERPAVAVEQARKDAILRTVSYLGVINDQYVAVREEANCRVRLRVLFNLVDNDLV